MTDFSEKLLSWYDRNARPLPWRVPPAERQTGVLPDPYRVWLSEVMLQQTTIPHGIRYFERFTELWPTVEALALADRDDVMREWAGLGYYARARNLHACAKQIVDLGGFPPDPKDLIKLPGIGPYTAGAIAAIAFERRAIAVDGNVERVFSRQMALSKPVRDAKSEIKAAVEAELPLHRFGDFAQALMDLGATICSPRSPECKACPVSMTCQARQKGNPESFPVKAQKVAKPDRYGEVYICHDGIHLIVERRPDKGLLAGMIGLPTTDWTKGRSEISEKPEGVEYVGQVQHVFTHFRLTLQVYELAQQRIDTEQRAKISEIESIGLPSLFAKAVKLWLRQRAS